MSHQEQLIPHDHVLRYNFNERMNHWVAAGSFIYLMLTGLAFWSPWLFWMASALGGAELSRMLHPWVGLVFFVSVCYMYALWSSQMKHDPVDSEWWKSLHYYIRNEDDKMPPAGRYNAGQKLLFWSFFLGGIVLLATGLVLWFTESIPWAWRWVRYLSVVLHAGTALLMIGNLMIHVYMGVFAERGAFGSVIRGDVSLAFAKRYHPGWYQEIVRKSARTK
ncbi:MAG TPA: formate dehydrogenase subunit gamma [Candidatus Acidoferrum sp.]|nr:formate dehydrogenase subunit gamma [Candidatus Acidoferrum sp.]